jgi:hypothetical protein
MGGPGAASVHAVSQRLGGPRLASSHAALGLVIVSVGRSVGRSRHRLTHFRRRASSQLGALRGGSRLRPGRQLHCQRLQRNRPGEKAYAFTTAAAPPICARLSSALRPASFATERTPSGRTCSAPQAVLSCWNCFSAGHPSALPPPLQLVGLNANLWDSRGRPQSIRVTCSATVAPPGSSRVQVRRRPAVSRPADPALLGRLALRNVNASAVSGCARWSSLTE